MTWLDWLIVAVLVFSVLMALFRGFFREACSFAGLIAGIWLAAWNYPLVAAPLRRFITSEGIADAIAFILIAVVVMLVAGLAGYVLSKTFRVIGLGWLDSLLGGVFGFFRGCLLVTIGMMAVAAFLPQSTWAHDSTLAPYFLMPADELSSMVPAVLRVRIREGVILLRSKEREMMRKNEHEHK